MACDDGAWAVIIVRAAIEGGEHLVKIGATTVDRAGNVSQTTSAAADRHRGKPCAARPTTNRR
ncbi:hypothetical protein C357_16066 [Citreicella sp. 357]|nr:hypothetical protein C357_16066 [Citreicella sp. 357]